MKTILVLVFCGLVAGFGWPGTNVMNTVEDLPQDGSQQEARRLWEQAIAAKGGRERLYAVRNLVVSYRGNKDVALYVFPDKVWEWTDDRPTWLGLYAEMHNLERGLAYFVTSEDSAPPINKGRGSNLSRGAPALTDAQRYYLLETQWVKPKPVIVATGRVGQQQTDVVETLSNGSRVDFHLDRKSHLPLEVAIPSDDSTGTSYGRGTYYVTFSDYREVGGIQMPHRVGFLTNAKVDTTFEIDVEYDEQIFERPPNIADGPGAWKAVRQSQRSKTGP